MNYVILDQFQKRTYLKFIGEDCHTYGIYFYCVKPEDEIKIPEIKALEMLNHGRNHVLESVPHNEYWTLNKLVQLMESKKDSCFIVYADIDHKRAMNSYTWNSLDNSKDIPIYSIISIDP